MRDGRPHRIIARTLAAAALAIAVPTLLACDPPGGEDPLQKAEASRAAGNIRAGMIELMNALQKNPQNARARLLLGETFLDLGDGPQAEIELKRARELGAPAERATLLLLEAKLIQGKAQEVAGEIPALDAYPPATRAAFLVLRAQTHLASGQIAEAERDLASAVHHDEDALDPRLGLARLALARGSMADAQQHFARAAAIAPQDFKTILLQGEIAAQSGRFDEAEKAYRAVLTKRKDDQAALRAEFGMAQALLSQDKTREAVERLDQVLKIVPNHPTPNYLRALAAYQVKDYPTAKAHAESALRAQPDHRSALFIAGSSSYVAGQYEQALKHLGEFVALSPDNPEARRLLAATKVRLGASRRARVAEPAVRTSPLAVMAAATSAQASESIAPKRSLADAFTASADADDRARLGLTRIVLGDVTGAIEDLESTTKDGTRDARADITLITTYLREREYDRAAEAAHRLQQREPRNAAGFTAEGIAFAAKGDIAKAKAAFAKARDVNPEDRAALRNLAQIAGRDGDFETARRIYDGLLRRRPNDADTLLQYGQLELQANRPEQAIARTQEAIAARPDALLPRIALARLHLLRNEPAKALAMTQPLLREGSSNSALVEIAGRSQFALGQVSEAVATFRRLIAARPEEAAGYQFLASAYEAEGRTDQAIRQVETALRLEPMDPGLRFAHARLLSRIEQFEDAGKIIAGLSAAYPGDAAVAALEGAIAMATNRPSDAVEAYKRAHAAQQTMPTLVYLARALVAAGRDVEAEVALQNWLKQNPDDVAPRIVLGEIQVRTNQLAKAEAEYAEALRRAPGNPRLLATLAWTMAETGKAQDALPHARRAVQLAPDDPVVGETLGYVLMRSGRTDEAINVLRRAAGAAPNQQSIQVRLAQALLGAGNKAEAGEMLRRVLAENPVLAVREQAEALLAEVGG